jgi:hypothetical protein
MEKGVQSADVYSDSPDIEIGAERSVGILHPKCRERLERDFAALIGRAVRVDELERDVACVVVGTGVLEHFSPNARCAAQNSGFGSIAITRQPRDR